MGQQRVEIKKTFPYPVSRVFAHLSEHENLSALFAPARVERIRDGNDAPNGTGSIRRLSLPAGKPFEETVTLYEPDRRIEYTITKGSPLRNHKGVMEFEADGEGSRLHYTIVFEGKLPLVGPLVRRLLDRGIRKGLDRMRL